MYIATIPNRSSPPAILLRESYRQGGQVKTRTLANLTDWPPAQLDALRHVLRGDLLVAPEDAFEIVRSLPHGHVAAVLGTVRRLGLDGLIAAKKSGHRALVLAMIVARILAPQSKLATARGLGPDTASTSLGAVLHVEAADADALYSAMDWPAAPPTPARSGPRGPASGGGHARPVRPHLDVFRRAYLSVGAVWPQPRWQKGQGADCGGAGV